MKILSIVWYKVLPSIYGGQKGTALFNKYLSAHADISCLCSSDNADNGLPYKLIPALPVGKKQFLNPRCWSLIRRTLKEQESSLLILEHPYHGIGAVKAIKGSKTRLIIHSHNIESERFRQLGKPGWQILAQYEKWVHRKATLSLFKTEKDRQFAILKFGLKESSCIVVPYGIEAETISVRDKVKGSIIREKFGVSEDEKVLLFAGTLDYLPNANAMTAIYEELAPALERLNFKYKIIICGRLRFRSFQYLQKLSHPNIHFVNETPDLEQFYHATDVFINPVAEGSGVQTKNIEALARNCTVVGFKEMMDESILKYAGNKVLTATRDDWQGFAHQVIAASAYTQDTPDDFCRFFSWKRITADLAGRLDQI